MTFLFCCLHLSYGQKGYQKKIDSVLTTTAKSNEKESYKKYLKLCSWILKDAKIDNQEALDYIVSKNCGDYCKMNVIQKFALKFILEGKTEKSLQLRLQGLELAKKNDDPYFMTRYSLDIVDEYVDRNKPIEALQLIQTTESYLGRLQEDYRDANAAKCRTWHLKADVYRMIGDHDRALGLYEDAFSKCKKINAKIYQKYLLIVLLRYIVESDLPEKQVEYMEEYHKVFGVEGAKKINNHMPIDFIFKSEIKPQNIDKYRQIIKISDSLQNIETFFYASMVLSDIYASMSNYNLALNVLLRTKERFSGLKNHDNQQLILQRKLSQIYYGKSDYKSAYASKIRENEMRDSLTQLGTKKTIAELEIQYETEKKDREIAQQSLQIQKKENQKTQLLGGLLGLGLALLFTGAFFWKRLQYQKTIAEQNRELQAQQIKELQQQNKLLALNSMIEGQEAERMRIAKDLHDSLGGLLSTVKAHFTSIQNEIKQLERLNITEKTNELIDEACVEVRRISHDMIPHALTLSGLPGVLEDMVESLRAEGYEVELDIKDFPDAVENTKQAMLFRLVQEVFSNIRKHAGAKQILIQILGMDQGLSLIIEDDGVGFDYEKASASGGVGLKSINSRVEFLDGTIDWDTATKEGTTITINIPSI